MVEDITSGGERRLSVGQHACLLVSQHRLDVGTCVEVAPQLLVDGLIHPVARLLVTLALEVAVGFHIVEISVNHVPHFCDTYSIVAGVA